MSDPEPKDDAARRLENLRAVYAGLQAPPAGRAGSATPARASAPMGAPRPERHRGRNSGLGLLLAGVVFVLGKLKVFAALAGILKFKTLGSMLATIAVYAAEWGWAFALGFVLLIFVHELGHAIVMRREGIPAGAPVFIPFLGAFIAMKGRPRDAYVEAKVAMGGPVSGSLAAWAVLAAGMAMRQPLLVSLGHAGILINLFNLIPVSPLDGGRVAGAFTRGFWIAGYALGLLALLATRSPLLLLVLVVGLFTLWQRLRHPVPGYDTIPSARRLAVGLGYAALVLALVLTLPLGLAPPPAAGA
jgi:Zn-dependent protease